jgi:hypothetical protein
MWSSGIFQLFQLFFWNIDLSWFQWRLHGSILHGRCHRCIGHRTHGTLWISPSFFEWFNGDLWNIGHRLVRKVRDVTRFFFVLGNVNDWSWFWAWKGGYLCGIVMENCHEPPHFPFAASHSILGGVLVHFQVFKGQKCYEMFMTCFFPICSLYQVLSHDSSIKSRPSCHVASLKTYIYIHI